VKRLARRKEMITMRQENGTKTKYPGIYSLSDETFRIVAKAVDPKTGRARFKERYTREMDPAMTQNAAVAYRAELIEQIKTDLTASGTSTRIPRLETLCRPSWITFVTENVNSEDRAAKLSRVIETHILKRCGSYFIDKITVPEIDAWVRDLTTNYSPETIRHHVGLFRRILGKARGQYQLMPIDWDLITLPGMTNEHTMKNRLNAEQIAMVLPIIVELYPFYAPMIFTLYTLGLRYCHVAAMRWEKLTLDGVIAIEETYDVSANVFSPVDQRKKAPPVIALEPRTLEQDKHLHYSRGVTVEEMRRASMALMQLVPSGPVADRKVGAKVGTEAVGAGNRMTNRLWPPDLSRRTT